MSDAQIVASEIEAWAAGASAAVAEQVRWYANLGLGRVKANASGRPGPRRVTGDYLRTMNVEFDGEFAASIGTGAPQGRRLEMGFVGVDSLGRHYHQPPYPHFGPMADWIEEPFAMAVARAVLPG